ncbi:MAG: response regulator, partial [Ignavibacteriae bacterium]
MVMSTALSILLLEDDPSSIRLFDRKIQSAPVEMKVKDVRNKESFLRELETPRFDCIVIDYTLPDINGLEALRLVNELAPGTPTIIYTGSVGEEKAVDCMKEGASEFL